MEAISTLEKTLTARMDDISADVVRWRRHLHQNPELSFHEENTSRFVFDTLQSFGNLVVSRPTSTSVMARLIGKVPGKTVAIRGDMDALPIWEETTSDFTSSIPGVMHACGHDGHTAILLATAKVLSGLTEQLAGEVRFIFQHGEEAAKGAPREIIKTGALDGVDSIIAAHIWPTIATGRIGIIYGPAMAASDGFTVKIIGKGGHAAKPHETVDPIVAGAHVVAALQQIVSRKANPRDCLVLSVTQFSGGNSFNVIPDVVEMKGCTRYFDPQWTKKLPLLMERLIKGVCEAQGASWEFDYHSGNQPVVNDREVTRVLEATAREIVGEEAVVFEEPQMISEDFSLYQQQVPGALFFIGTANPAKNAVYPLHHPRFTLDEDALVIGVKMMAAAAVKLLAADHPAGKNK